MNKSHKLPKRKTNLTYILGLDLGPASVGWAVIRCDKKKSASPKELIDCGVRRFEAGVSGDIEKGRDTPNSVARRLARGPRRNTWRQQWRMRKLFRLLSSYKMLPETEDSPDARHQTLLRLDAQLREKYLDSENPSHFHVLPYRLRAKALDEKLPLHALGRAIYQLGMRRGYKSNRKTQGDENERGEVQKGINRLFDDMDKVKARTLGEYFSRIESPDKQETGEQVIRGKWTSREMFENEFEMIWSAQKSFHKSVLTDQMKGTICKAIFEQRPLKSQKNLIGRCSIFPSKRGAPVASLPAQEFRLLQKLNNLEAYAADGEITQLSENIELRDKLLLHLSQNGDATWQHVRKCLGLGKNHTFNLQEGGEKKLTGNRTAKKFRDVNPNLWDSLTKNQQTNLVDDFLSFESEEALQTRLENFWNFPSDQAKTLARLYVEPGYSGHCRKALKLLNEKLNKGVSYSTAKKQLEEDYGNSQNTSPVHDFLPPLTQVPEAGNIRNPSVLRTLSELRKVVNEVIRCYGKPFRIRVELARDLKNPRQRREEHSRVRDRNQKARENAKKRILEEMQQEGIAGKRSDVEKLLLADECNWICPYCGISLGGMRRLYSGGTVQVEHIIPQSKSFDNSFGNKTLSCSRCNVEKSSKTPFQAFSGDKNKWNEILIRVKNFQGEQAKRKLRLFEQEHLNDDFEEKLLNDTRHSSVAAKNYLGMLYGGETEPSTNTRIVQCSPGRCTSLLRNQWNLNLNRVLGTKMEKSRDDHRHHAVDAIVIALTSPSVLNIMSKYASKAESNGDKTRQFVDGEPWKGFESQVREKVDSIVVSSRVNRKLNGSLHKDTILSHPKGKRSDDSYIHHVRKPLKSLSKAEVEAIVDNKIRELVKEKLASHKGTPDKVFSDKNNLPKLTSKKDPRIVVDIKSVRIRKTDKPMPIGKGSARRFVNPGSNHHMEIVAVLDKNGNEKKWEGILVSRFDANQRKRDGQPVIQKEHGDGRKFKFSLTGTEHVLMNFDGESEKVYRAFSISKSEIEFVLHSDARPKNERTKHGGRVRMSPGRLKDFNGKKVSINPIGRMLEDNS